MSNIHTDSFDFTRYSKMNFGCGYDKILGYLNVDVDEACAPDLLIPFGDLSSLPRNHFSEILAKDVLEHVPRAKTLEILLYLSGLMRIEGKLIVQTTSIIDVANKLKNSSSFADQYGWTICLFGNQAHPGDFHYTGFTDITLTVHLNAAGFEVLHRDMVDGWMMRFECYKRESWDELCNTTIDNETFLKLAYSRFFYRDLDDIGRLHFGKLLHSGISKYNVLLQIASAPERLYVVARQMNIC